MKYVRRSLSLVRSISTICDMFGEKCIFLLNPKIYTTRPVLWYLSRNRCTLLVGCVWISVTAQSHGGDPRKIQILKLGTARRPEAAITFIIIIILAHCAARALRCRYSFRLVLLPPTFHHSAHPRLEFYRSIRHGLLRWLPDFSLPFLRLRILWCGLHGVDLRGLPDPSAVAASCDPCHSGRG